MSKLKIEDLSVESFVTGDAKFAKAGTVRAHDLVGPTLLECGGGSATWTQQYSCNGCQNDNHTLPYTCWRECHTCEGAAC
jgi:hypothetical protein